MYPMLHILVPYIWYLLYFQAEGNAGKKSIIVDFKSEGGKRIARELIKRSDIVLFNKSDEQVRYLQSWTKNN